MNQKTINGEFTLSGKGLHTGLEIVARFLPAPENHGYKFKRVDLEEQPVIDALAENVVATNRGTVIAKGEARVSTIEHAMAALYAAGIDNVLIEVNAPEMASLSKTPTRISIISNRRLKSAMTPPVPPLSFFPMMISRST